MKGCWTFGVMPAFAVSVGLVAGAVHGQDTSVVMICSVMTTNAETLMSIRQKGVPRATVDASVADDKVGKVKEFTEWMVEAAYNIDIASTPDLVPFVITEFAGMVYDQCITEKW